MSPPLRITSYNVCYTKLLRLARDVTQYGVITVGREDSVYKAIEIMVQKKISGLPVVDHIGLVGIISEKDVLKLLYDTEFLTGNVGDYSYNFV